METAMDLPWTASNNACMSKPPLLRAERLGRRFGSHRAVSAFDLVLARGEVLGLLGLNGAGKTTALQMLAGVLAPDEGRIEIKGEDLARAPRAAKRHLGYLPQSPPLFEDAGVEEFLHFCAELHEVPAAHRTTAVARALARCGLQDVRRRMLRALSGGYRQRVGIAQAIVHEPAVVILDEPTTGLDPAQRMEVRALIQSLRAEHAVLLSSHLLSEVETLCTRAVILHGGRIVHEEALEARQSWVELSLGAPPELARVTEMAGTDAVEQIGPDRFAFPLPSDLAVLGRLLTHAARHWQARDFTLQSSRLEHVFTSLVRDAPGERG
ncbi:MAG: hypothetical protein RL434_3121 [Pseudomonadota bacterium]|jgi:ABC-2 type transport system ATP-binding protein